MVAVLEGGLRSLRLQRVSGSGMRLRRFLLHITFFLSSRTRHTSYIGDWSSDVCSSDLLVSFIFIKPYYDYKVFSIYEYLTARFGVGTKNAASAIFLFTRLLASGARLYVAAIALALAYEMIRGVRPTQTETLWIYVGATVAIVLLTAIYTTLGGIKAVIWTDLIQASIMIGSALVALGLLYSAIPGGWHSIVEHRGPFHLSDLITTGLDPEEHGWQKIAGMFAIEYTIFAGLIGSTFMTMSTHGTDQDMGH